MERWKELTGISASTISSPSDCEQKFAFERLEKDVPAIPVPYQLVYGTVIHLAHERMWKTEISSGSLSENATKYWLVFLNNVFNGIHGPRGEDEPPIAIRWLTPIEDSKLTPEEKNNEIKEKKKKLIGGAYNTLRAIFLEATGSSEFVKARTQIEYNFGDKNILIQTPGGLSLRLSGRIDRIQFRPNDDFEVIDLKTGKLYIYGRNKLVRDIQMTQYQYATEIIFGRSPSGMFIQPATVSKKDLEERGCQALRDKLIPVEIREDPLHYQNLANLADDVWQTVRMVTHPDLFSLQQKKDWRPKSFWGRIARFTDNVLQERFMPRIGNWCEICSFVEICQKRNPDDWQEYLKSLEPKAALPQEPAPKQVPPQGILFENPKSKAKYLPKGEKEIKKELQGMGYKNMRGLLALIKKIPGFIPVPGSGPCACRRLELIPLPLVENFFRFSRREITLKEWLSHCPYSDCPFKSNPPPVK